MNLSPNRPRRTVPPPLPVPLGRAGAGGLLIGSVEGLLTAPNGLAAPGPSGPRGPGYGPLVDDPARRLSLPCGFRYTVVSEAGVTRLDTGQPSPTNGDGTGAFAGPDGTTVLVQNHELRESLAVTALPVPPLPGLTYDRSAAGGTTTITLDAEGRRVSEGSLRELGPTDGAYEAMSCTDADGEHVDDLSRATEVGTTYRATWSAVPDRDARAVPTRTQLALGEVTRGRKLEGTWWGGGAHLVSSFAREESPVPHDGKVWFYDPGAATLTLRLRFGINPTPEQDGTNYDGPDNITVSPWGGVIIAEDGEGVQHLVGATDSGQICTLARNDRNTNEMTGPVFSADDRILFANLYEPGTTYAITGPWRTQR